MNKITMINKEEAELFDKYDFLRSSKKSGIRIIPTGLYSESYSEPLTRDANGELKRVKTVKPIGTVFESFIMDLFMRGEFKTNPKDEAKEYAQSLKNKLVKFSASPVYEDRKNAIMQLLNIYNIFYKECCKYISDACEVIKPKGFTHASYEMNYAIELNPFDIEYIDDIKFALTKMELGERYQFIYNFYVADYIKTILNTNFKFHNI